MLYFIFGLDEESICSDHHGNVKIIGSTKKNHELFLQYSRVYITVVRTGSDAGVTGPTIFLFKGKQCHGIFIDEFLGSKG